VRPLDFVKQVVCIFHEALSLPFSPTKELRGRAARLAILMQTLHLCTKVGKVRSQEIEVICHASTEFFSALRSDKQTNANSYGSADQCA